MATGEAAPPQQAGLFLWGLSRALNFHSNETGIEDAARDTHVPLLWVFPILSQLGGETQCLAAYKYPAGLLGAQSALCPPSHRSRRQQERSTLVTAQLFVVIMLQGIGRQATSPRRGAGTSRALVMPEKAIV